MTNEKLLRTYERMAQIPHWCDRCCRYIEPGEIYQGKVFVDGNRKKHRLIVFKFHIFPECDYPEEPNDKYQDKEESNLEHCVKQDNNNRKEAA